ncbi:MAG: HNH endonuclease [Bacillota bacterium]|nr:HNH endonuclease [Bacillota bacterium]MDO5440265.1 HNH endonuclease [Erysipelotrichaceae bacterium]
MQISGDYRILIVILAILIPLIVIAAIDVKRENTVLKNSRVLKEIKDLNEQYKDLFDGTLRYNYYFSLDCDNLNQFKARNRDKSLYMISELNRFEFLQIDRKVKSNNKYYSKYLKCIDRIDDFLTRNECELLKVKYSNASEIEHKHFDKEKLITCTTPLVTIEVEYVSPAGQSRHKKSYSYTWENVLQQIKIIDDKENRKNSKEYQRSIMSSSLRYDVLNRDNFRCTICGRTARDGVKLVIDHIVPVSKGGKTTMSNLRVLCEECNLGKSDKYDEYDTY